MVSPSLDVEVQKQVSAGASWSASLLRQQAPGSESNAGGRTEEDLQASTLTYIHIHTHVRSQRKSMELCNFQLFGCSYVVNFQPSESVEVHS